MNEKSKIVLISLFVIIGLIYSVYLFVIPNFIDLNAYKPQIKQVVKDATGLEVEPGNLKLSTYPDFSIKLTTENAKVDKYLTLEKASVRVLLPALIFKKLEVEEVTVEKPQVFLTRLKNGKYDIETDIQPKPSPKHQQTQTTAMTKPVSAKKTAAKPPIETVFRGMNLRVSDYVVNLKDNSGQVVRNFALKGDVLEISKFQPDKFIKLASKGSLLVEDNPNINFDIKLASELPVIKPEKQIEQKSAGSTSDAKPHKSDQQAKHQQNIDPIEKILKYNPKVDIKADLNIKSRKTLPEIDGFLSFENLSIIVDGQKLPDSRGEFNFEGKKIIVDSKLFITPDSFFKVAGNINNLANQDFNINVKSSDIDLKDVKKFAYSLADAANADISALNDVGLAGQVKADFNLQKDKYQGYLTINETRISHTGLSVPLKNLNSTLNFDRDKVVFTDTAGQLGDIDFDVTGNINNKLISDIKVSIPSINLNTVYSIANNSALLADLRPQLKDISSLGGNIGAEVLVKGSLKEEIKPEIKAWINRISAFYVPSQMPILVTGGNISVDQSGKINFNNIKTDVADMPLNITGQFTGDADAWKLTANSDISNIEYLTGKNTAKIEAEGDLDSVKISDAGLYSEGKKVVSVSGSIENGTDLNDIKADISGLTVNIKEPKGIAQLNGKLVLVGKIDAPKALGDIKLTTLDIPSLQFKTNDIAIGLTEDLITLNTGVLSIVDSKIKLSANVQNKLTPPFIVRSVQINSEYLDVDKLTAALQPQPSAHTAHAPRHQVQPGQSQQGQAVAGQPQSEPDVQVIINSGKFYARELIVNKLQNKDVSFDFTLRPLNQLAIRNFITHTAGGTAVGIADMNLKTSKLGVDFTADNVEINALATTLANLPNEVFGGMKGRIKLSTIGKTPEAMIQNALGRADFSINNGHLGKLGDLGYLLKAVQIKNMDSLSTNHFDDLKGHVLINRGVLDVQQITMQGKRMSSHISGSVRMKDNYADLTVLNKLHGKIVSQLGFIADLSVNKLAKQIPGKWGQLLGEMAAEARLSNEYPNRGKIPTLNEESTEPNKDFAVQIKGVLGQPGSVRMIEWLE